MNNTNISSYLDPAFKHIGLKEHVGKASNPKLLQLFKIAKSWITDDNTPWCGAFLAGMLVMGGHTTVKGAEKALNWVKYGEQASKKVGAIVVFSREGGGHVGFIVKISEDGNLIYVLGGNQQDQVKISIFDVRQRPPIAYRKPKGVILPLTREYKPFSIANITTSTKEV